MKTIAITYPIITLLLFSCTSFDSKKATQEILELHNAQRSYHFQKNAGHFVDQFSQEIIMLNNGRISAPSRAESLQRFDNYFNSVEFIKWDDLREPIIRFSEDGTLALPSWKKK